MATVPAGVLLGAAEGGPDLVRRAPLERVAFDARFDLVRGDTAGPAHLVRRSTVEQVLLPCTAFEPLRAHASAVAKDLGLGAEKTAPMEELLGDLATRGLFVGARALLGEAPAEPRDPPLRIATVAVVTRERPELLARCLERLMANLREHGEACRVLVADDSDPPCAAQQRELVRSLSRRHGIPAAHAGRAEKDAFVSRLARAGFDPALIGEALAAGGREDAYGVNRNAVLLDTVGDAFVSLDDDVVAQVVSSASLARPHERPAAALTIGSGRELVRHHPDRERLLTTLSPTDASLVGLHADHLGRTPRSHVAALDRDAPVDLDGADDDALSTMRRATVRVTELGYAGDAGQSTATWVLARIATGLAPELADDPDALDLALRSRESFRASATLTLAPPSAFLAGAAGFDHTTLLPPFLPQGRGEDAVFTTVLRACDPGAWTAALPWAVLHLPPPGRSYVAVTEPYAPFDCDVVRAVVRSCAATPLGATPAGRMQALGERLEALGASSRDDGPHLLARARAELWAGRVRLLDAVRESSGARAPALARRLQDARARLIARVEAERPAPDLARLAARLARFGALLRRWPDLVEAARDLRARGEGLFRPVDE